ncbi:MAG TPA: DUF1428 family protein, partial [Verrucomicrobiales bacterium]|nr:DUF1428 family protein [Verrucomicrobiales bacterium]
AYRRIARKASKVWIDHGALEYCEAVGEDLDGDGCGTVSFRKIVEANPEETVVFAWIVYKSRAQRDRVKTPHLERPPCPHRFHASPSDPTTLDSI